jgi:predicted nucleic acid-binding Zn ribbon protein
MKKHKKSKRCSVCGKGIAHWNKSGLCSYHIQKEYAEKNRNNMKEYQKEYYLKNREKKLKYQKEYYENTKN